MASIVPPCNYINGEFRSTVDVIEVENPATGDVIGLVAASTEADVADAVAAARAAQRSFRLLPAIERAGYLRKIAAGIRDRAEMLTDILVAEQGKTQGLARVEVDFTADYLDYMAEWARRIEGEVITSDRPKEQIFLLRKPLGVVGGILPWNFPFFLIARKAAPALLTGNTIVVKPASVTPLNCVQFADIVDEAGVPAGVFNMVTGRGGVGAALSGSPDVDMVSFTGSVDTGAKIMAAAAPNITKVNLELGGKAPAIVLADADLDLAARAIHASRVINTGQVCNCAERVYVEEAVAEEFIAKVTALMAGTRYGNPAEVADLDMGPLVSQDQLDQVEGMVERAKAAGACAVTGGARAEGAGYHYQPTVLTGCTADMEIMREEIFGPVLPIQVVKDFDEAIALANDTDFGLTSSVYTTSVANAMKAMREIDFGETYINRENFEAMQGFHAGTRKSGIGGADGKHGLYEYTRTQVVYLES